MWFTRSTFAKAFALGGCAICSAVHAAERKGIHSFLHEGMMFPSVRKKFLDGGGFCLHHFWMAKAIEEYAWQTGGFGIAILCSDLASLAGSGLANANESEPNPRSSLLRRRQKPPFVPGHDCMFCQDNRDKEQFLAQVLEELVDEEEFHKPLAEHGLCIRHGELSLQTWKDSRKREELFSQLGRNLAIWRLTWESSFASVITNIATNFRGANRIPCCEPCSSLLVQIPVVLELEKKRHEDRHHL